MKKYKSPEKKHIAHTPVVIQMEKTECGAACLTMVLAYCGLFVPLSQIRSDCDTNRDGVNAGTIAKVAEQYGLKAHGFRYSHDALMNKATYPCMILWEYNHFVILNGFRGKHAYINDPARGQVTIPINDFWNSYSDFCIVFEKTSDFVPAGKPTGIISFVGDKLKKTRKTFIYMLLMTIVSALIGLFSPAFSHIFINGLQNKGNSEWLYVLITIMCIVAIIQLITEIIANISRLRISGRFCAIGASEYFWHALRLPISFYNQRSVGDIQSRQEDNETIASTLIESFAPLCFDMVLMLLYLTVMLHYSIILTIIGVVSIIINLFISGIIAKRQENISRVLQQSKGRLYGTTAAGISMIETIKSGGAEGGYFERWADCQADVINQTTSFVRVNAFLGNLTGLISSLSNILVLFLGVFLVINGKLSQGAIMAFQGYLGLFYAPVHLLADTRNGIMEMRGTAERLDDVMHHPVDPVTNEFCEEDKHQQLTGKIELHNISFSYSKHYEQIIKNISLTIEPGQCIAFVGKSGCGKSTLSKLLTGLYMPQTGEILYDGKSIDKINRETFTGSVAMVEQNIVLFDDTVANNIRLFDDSIEDTDIVSAAKDACIHDEIMLRPGGYQHHMRENGRDYSGGQRQRIEIARALASKPRILILDEATSALDAITELEVLNSINGRNITTIIIAHRLSAIRNCDKIYVLNNGTIAEFGTHEELINAGGLYKQLVANEQEAF